MVAVAGKASLSFYVVALLAQGATTATSLTVQQHTDPDTDHNASRASAHTQVAPNGYTAHGINCNCGPRIQQWSENDDETTCAAKCDADSSCVSFGLWSGGHPGYCALFDVVCVGVDGHVDGDLCPNPTASAYTNAVFNKATTSASATGDPHLQNLHGERFDLTRPGKFALIHIPRGQPVEDALLVVEADASQLGGQCTDMYFVKLNVTGAWADAVQAGGLRFDTDSARDEAPKWAKLGPVELKVARGRTAEGVKYLNVFVKHLGRAGFAVGGILGEDDHEDASAPQGSCVQRVSLDRRVAPKLGGSSGTLGRSSAEWL